MGEKDLELLKKLVKKAQEEFAKKDYKAHLKTLQRIGEHVYLIASMEGVSIKNTDSSYNELVEA